MQSLLNTTQKFASPRKLQYKITHLYTKLTHKMRFVSVSIGQIQFNVLHVIITTITNTNTICFQLSICAVVLLALFTVASSPVDGFKHVKKAGKPEVKIVYKTKPIFISKIKPVFIPKPIIVKKRVPYPVLKKIHVLHEKRVPIIKEVVKTKYIPKPFPVHVVKIKHVPKVKFVPVKVPIFFKSKRAPLAPVPVPVPVPALATKDGMAMQQQQQTQQQQLMQSTFTEQQQHIE